MVTEYFNSFQSERLKMRKSSAMWLVVAGSFFIPFIMLVLQFIKLSRNPSLHSSPVYWDILFDKCWESMAIFLLPMGIILLTGMVGQMEYRNNTWKQLHTTPQRYSIIFLAKLSIVLNLILLFFIFFLFGIFIAGILPAIFINKSNYIIQKFPLMKYLRLNGEFFIDCLPIVAFQFLLSLRFRNFLLPVGVGLVAVVGSVFALTWAKGYIIPYNYVSIHYLRTIGESKVSSTVNIHLLAVFWFLFFTFIGYMLYINKKDKA